MQIASKKQGIESNDIKRSAKCWCASLPSRLGRDSEQHRSEPTATNKMEATGGRRAMSAKASNFPETFFGLTQRNVPEK